MRVLLVPHKNAFNYLVFCIPKMFLHLKRGLRYPLHTVSHQHIPHESFHKVHRLFLVLSIKMMVSSIHLTLLVLVGLMDLQFCMCGIAHFLPYVVWPQLIVYIGRSQKKFWTWPQFQKQLRKGPKSAKQATIVAK